MKPHTHKLFITCAPTLAHLFLRNVSPRLEVNSISAPRPRTETLNENSSNSSKTAVTLSHLSQSQLHDPIHTRKSATATLAKAQWMDHRSWAVALSVTLAFEMGLRRVELAFLWRTSSKLVVTVRHRRRTSTFFYLLRSKGLSKSLICLYWWLAWMKRVSPLECGVVPRNLPRSPNYFSPTKDHGITPQIEAENQQEKENNATHARGLLSFPYTHACISSWRSARVCIFFGGCLQQ